MIYIAAYSVAVKFLANEYETFNIIYASIPCKFLT